MTKPAPVAPLTPRRWFVFLLASGTSSVAGVACGETERDAEMDVLAKCDGATARGKLPMFELTPTKLAAMLAESRAWYADQLALSSGEREG